MSLPGNRGAISRRLVVWICVFSVLAVLVFGGWFINVRREQMARAAWKSTALSQLAGISFASEGIVEELRMLKLNQGTDQGRGWAGSRILLMKNGEYLIYVWRHGYNIGTVDHLFLAHGSDGRWYYSTFHFCQQMVGLGSDSAPESISEFASRYAVREFDGRSDVCLQHTWP